MVKCIEELRNGNFQYLIDNNFNVDIYYELKVLNSIVKHRGITDLYIESEFLDKKTNKQYKIIERFYKFEAESNIIDISEITNWKKV